MAVGIMGNTGAVAFKTSADATILLHISGWSFDWDRESHDITDFDSTDGWKDMTVGLCKITGSLQGFYQDSAEVAIVAADLILVNAKLTLTASAGRTYTWASGIELSNISFATETGVPNTWTATFEAGIIPVIA